MMQFFSILQSYVFLLVEAGAEADLDNLDDAAEGEGEGDDDEGAGEEGDEERAQAWALVTG